MNPAKPVDGFGEIQKDDLCPAPWICRWFDHLWWISTIPFFIILIFSIVLKVSSPFNDWVFVTFSVLLAIEWQFFRYMLESVPRDLNILAVSGRLKLRYCSKGNAFEEELRHMIRWGPYVERMKWKPQIGYWKIASVAGFLLMIIYVLLFNDIYNWVGNLWTGLHGQCLPPHLIFGTVGVLHLWPIFDVAHCAAQNFISGLVGGPIPLIWALPIGAGIWVVVAIGLSLSQLTKMYEFDPIPGHPDGSGGLGKLGEICFRMGLLSILPQLVTLAIYIQGKKISTDSIVVLMAGIVSLIFALLAIPGFILPMWNIHEEMRIRCDEYEAELAQKIIEAENQLRAYFHPVPGGKSKADKPDLQAIQKEIDTLQKLSSKARDFPTWPFSRRIALVISPNIIIPLATLILPNLPQQFKDLIVGVLSLGGKS